MEGGLADSLISDIEDRNARLRKTMRYGGPYGQALRESYISNRQAMDQAAQAEAQAAHELESRPSVWQELWGSIATAVHDFIQTVSKAGRATHSDAGPPDTQRAPPAASNSAESAVESKPRQGIGNIFDMIAKIPGDINRANAAKAMKALLADQQVHGVTKIGCPYCEVQKQLVRYTEENGTLMGNMIVQRDGQTLMVKKPAGSKGLVDPEIARRFTFHEINSSDHLEELLQGLSGEQRSQAEAVLLENERTARFIHQILAMNGINGVPALINPCGDVFIGAMMGENNTRYVVETCAGPSDDGLFHEA